MRLKAAGQKDGCHGAFTGMEATLCADYAMRIEDWRERYQIEEGDGPEVD